MVSAFSESRSAEFFFLSLPTSHFDVGHRRSNINQKEQHQQEEEYGQLRTTASEKLEGEQRSIGPNNEEYAAGREDKSNKEEETEEHIPLVSKTIERWKSQRVTNCIKNRLQTTG